MMEQAKSSQAAACSKRSRHNVNLRSDETVDYRFLQLIGLAAWQRLPGTVQRRFSKKLPEGTNVVYQGRVTETRLSLLGRCLAQAARLIGSPLPRDNGAIGPAVVIVTQNQITTAQNWVRTYTRPSGRTQTVTSEKRFQGPTGLEEYVGAGLGMTLDVIEDKGALTFRSNRYFIEAGRVRFYLPRMFAPGQMTIVHQDRGAGQFCFELDLRHPWFGELLHQVAHFDDPH